MHCRPAIAQEISGKKRENMKLKYIDTLLIRPRVLLTPYSLLLTPYSLLLTLILYHPPLAPPPPKLPPPPPPKPPKPPPPPPNPPKDPLPEENDPHPLFLPMPLPIRSHHGNEWRGEYILLFRKVEEMIIIKINSMKSPNTIPGVSSLLFFM